MLGIQGLEEMERSITSNLIVRSVIELMRDMARHKLRWVGGWCVNLPHQALPVGLPRTVGANEAAETTGCILQ
jgi:hypothetical protein